MSEVRRPTRGRMRIGARVSEGMDALGSLVLLAMFVLILLVSIRILWGWFVMVTHPPMDQIYREAPLLREQLRPDVVSFLFQVFTIALVTSGVYILTRTRANLRKAEETQKQLERRLQIVGAIVSDGPKCWDLASNVAALHHLTWLIKMAENRNTAGSLVSLVRDALRELRDDLLLCAPEQTGMPRRLRDSLLDRMENMNESLRAWPEWAKSEAEEFLSKLAECKGLLVKLPLVRNYEEQMSDFLNKGQKGCDDE